MFIINITYKARLSSVDDCLNDHIQYLNEQYEAGSFILSGPKMPRNGGIIISKLHSKKEVEDVIARDPFYVNGIADYEIIEFMPTKSTKSLKDLIKE